VGRWEVMAWRHGAEGEGVSKDGRREIRMSARGAVRLLWWEGGKRGRRKDTSVSPTKPKET